MISRLRVVVKKDAVTGVRLVVIGKQKKGLRGLAGTKLKYWWMAVTGQSGMWNAGKRDNMNSFLMLASLGPFYPEEAARSCEPDIAPSEVAFAVKS